MKVMGRRVGGAAGGTVCRGNATHARLPGAQRARTARRCLEAPSPGFPFRVCNNLWNEKK